MVGSHLYGDTPFAIGEDAIEEGYHKASGRPQEGLRFVYLPRQEDDLEMQECNYRLRQVGNNPGAIDLINNENYYANNLPAANPPPLDGQEAEEAADTGSWQVQQYRMNGVGAAELDWGNTELQQEAPSKFWGVHQPTKSHQFPNLIAIYWKGVPKNQDWIRIDVTRHFEGIPRPKLKNVLSMQRPLHCPKALEFALDRVKSQGKSAGHTIEEFKKSADQAKASMLIQDQTPGKETLGAQVGKLLGEGYAWWKGQDMSNTSTFGQYMGDAAQQLVSGNWANVGKDLMQLSKYSSMSM